MIEDSQFPVDEQQQMVECIKEIFTMMKLLGAICSNCYVPACIYGRLEKSLGNYAEQILMQSAFEYVGQARVFMRFPQTYTREELIEIDDAFKKIIKKHHMIQDEHSNPRLQIAVTMVRNYQYYLFFSSKSFRKKNKNKSFRKVFREY